MVHTDENPEHIKGGKQQSQIMKTGTTPNQLTEQFNDEEVEMKEPTEELFDSDSDDSEEEEIKQKKSGKKLPKKVKKDVKELKVISVDEVTKEDKAKEEEEALIADFLKSKTGTFKHLPALPDLATLIQDGMAKAIKEKTAELKGKSIPKEELANIRVRVEEEANEHIEAEKQRRENDRQTIIEKEIKDQIDAQLRIDQLVNSEKLVKDVVQNFRDTLKKEKEIKEWEEFLNCRKLPSPAVCNEMTTYLNMWKESMDFIAIAEACEKTDEVIELISDLEEVITLVTEDEKHKLENWHWIRRLFQEQQKQSLDAATYHLIKNVVNNMERVSIQEAQYAYRGSFVIVCVWLRVQTPIPLKNPRRRPSKKIEITFKELNNLKLGLPIVLDGQERAVRVMYLKYDHWCDKCDSFYPPPIPPLFELDLLQTVKNVWRMKQKYKYEHRDKREPTVPDPDDPDAEPWEPEPEEFGPDDEIPNVPYKPLNPTPSEYVNIITDHRYNEGLKIMVTKLPNDPKALNLRQSSILGGVFVVSYLHQPPQPAHYAIMTHIEEGRMIVPKGISYAPFFVEYEAPAEYIYYDRNAIKLPPPEVQEEEALQQEKLGTLIAIDLKIPAHVIFMETPQIYLWMEDVKYWSNEYIHYTHYNKEENRLSFRAQTFGIYGFASPRFANLPYQKWEIKPELDGSVIISITAAVLILEFIIKDGLICLSVLENSPNKKALRKELLEVFMKFHNLKKLLTEGGIDIFPDLDTHSYVTGSCAKDWSMERQLYNNMAAISGHFNFTWSKWNATLPRNDIVLHMREYAPGKAKQKNFSLLKVTPLSVVYVDCPDDAETFEPEIIEGKFSADLYNLMKNTVSMFLRNQIEAYPKENIYVLREFLVATKLLSFSSTVETKTSSTSLL